METLNGALNKNYSNSQMMKQGFLIYAFLPLVLFIIILSGFIVTIMEQQLSSLSFAAFIITILLLLITLLIHIICTIHIFITKEPPIKIEKTNKVQKIEFIVCIIITVLCIVSSALFALSFKNKEESILFPLSLQILLIYCINNLLYFSIPLSIITQGVVALVFTGCMIGFLSLGIRSTLIVAIVMLYVIFQNYNILNFNDTCLTNIIASDLNFIDGNDQNEQRVLARVTLNKNYLQKQIQYLGQLLNAFSIIENQMISFDEGQTDPFFLEYTPRVLYVLDEINDIISYIDGFAGLSNIPQSSIDELQNKLNNLLNMEDFQRCQVYFNQPTYTWDCGQFNLFYELMARIFSNFFASEYSSINFPIGYVGNEQVLRDIIMYARNTPMIFSSLTGYTRGLVDKIYVYIDGPALWTLLGGDITLDDSSIEMNNRILTQTNHYQKVRANNGVPYFDLLAELALRQDFFSRFNSNGDEYFLNWGLIRQLMYFMRSVQQLDTFGFVEID